MPTKQKSGLYRTKVKIGVKPDGSPLFKYVSAKTQRELENAKRAVIARYITGTGLEDDQLFGAYAVQWYKNIEASKLSHSTKASYRTALNLNILPVFGDRNLRSIKPSEIQTFINGFAGMSDTKITYIRASLGKIFDAACMDGILSESPMRRVKSPEASEAEEKRPLTQQEREAIVKVCSTHKYGLFLGCLYYLGLRQGEALGLQWGDFDADMRNVHIQRDIDFKNHASAGELKNKQSNRIVPIPAPLRDILGNVRGLPDVYLFRGSKSQTSLSKASAARLWCELMYAAGMVEHADPNNHYAKSDIRHEWTPTITPHYLRHNYITMCWEAGFDAFLTMKLVGHKNIQTTLNIYTHLSDAQRKNLESRIETVFGEKHDAFKADIKK